MRRRSLLALSAAAVLLAAAWGAARSPFAAQDRCLDAGGAWQDGACVGARS